MTTQNRINELKLSVNNAQTSNAEGRQVIANACKELYKTIEDALYDQYGAAAMTDAYKDLCNGNFAEPFMCEQKKAKFELYSSIYINNVLPKLQA